MRMSGLHVSLSTTRSASSPLGDDFQVADLRCHPPPKQTKDAGEVKNQRPSSVTKQYFTHSYLERSVTL